MKYQEMADSICEYIRAEGSETDKFVEEVKDFLDDLPELPKELHIRKLKLKGKCTNYLMGG